MKRKKARNWLSWTADWIKGGETKMTKGLSFLFNRIKEEGEIPKQCQLATIKSLRNKDDWGKLGENQKGQWVRKTQNENIH